MIGKAVASPFVNAKGIAKPFTFLRMSTPSQVAKGESNIQGVLAINKPANLTSADVVRVLQTKFSASRLFAPHLAHAHATALAAARRSRNSRGAIRRLERRAPALKIGHGGTLDPMATGVLIIGVGGEGTRCLGGFLGGRKEYETVVLFGAATDTYDVTGKVLRSGVPCDGVTLHSVREVLAARFSGEFMQRPPEYSARRIKGKRLYDMARDGEEISADMLKETKVVALEMEVLEFWEAGEHDFKIQTLDRAAWPTRGDRIKKRKKSAEAEDIQSSSKKIQIDGGTKNEVEAGKGNEQEEVEEPLPILQTHSGGEVEASMSGALENKTLDISRALQNIKDAEEAKLSKEAKEPEEKIVLGPAVKIRMTVSAGFYVRSLAHELGKALDSAACMATLVRTRSSQFKLGKNVLEFNDVDEEDESLWSPKVEELLRQWNSLLVTNQNKSD